MLTHLDGPAARQWAVLTRAALAARRAEIDALNVYPVPDGDTGTNLYLTYDEALAVVRNENERRGVLGQLSAAQEANALARAMLLTARGNSGVILSQIVAGFAQALAEADTGDERGNDAKAVAAGFARGAILARAAVRQPVEGTILSVLDACAGAAGAVAADGGDLRRLCHEAVVAATCALERTPEQLPVLADAGVVDAGGAGLLVLVESLDCLVQGEAARTRYRLDDVILNIELARRTEWGPVPATTDPTRAVRDLRPPAARTREVDVPRFEVMYLLESQDQDAVEALRARLDEIGDSVIVAGTEPTWSVHVHLDDAGAAIEAGLDAGRPSRIRVTVLDTDGEPAAPADGPAPRLDDPAREVPGRAGSDVGPGGPLGVVACSVGPGADEIHQRCGAIPVRSGPGRRASVGELLDAARRTAASTVLLLPNDRETRLAADAARTRAAEEGLQIVVLETRTAVQVLAALAVYEPDDEAGTNVVRMTRALAGTRHGGVTTAVTDGLTTGGPCRVGDVLGIVGGDIVIVGDDLVTVAGQVIDSLARGGGELVTLLVGDGLAPEDAERISGRACRTHPGIEVDVLRGGQAHYPLLVGVE